jgi:hypothetical protein
LFPKGRFSYRAHQQRSAAWEIELPDIIGGIVAIGFLVLWIYCIYDVITTEDAIIRHLPKVAWLLIVVLLPDLGSLLWLGLGRPRVWARRARDQRSNGPIRVGRYLGTPPDDQPSNRGLNPIVQYREEQARLRLREERLHRREQELRRGEVGEGLGN